MATNEDTNLMTVEDVAALLKVEKQLVYKLKRDRKIPFIKIGGVIRFRRVDVDQWIEQSIVK
jgi:excisionase family DNA binding protein